MREKEALALELLSNSLPDKTSLYNFNALPRKTDEENYNNWSNRRNSIDLTIFSSKLISTEM